MDELILINLTLVYLAKAPKTYISMSRTQASKQTSATNMQLNDPRISVEFDANYNTTLYAKLNEKREKEFVVERCVEKSGSAHMKY